VDDKQVPSYTTKSPKSNFISWDYPFNVLFFHNFPVHHTVPHFNEQCAQGTAISCIRKYNSCKFLSLMYYVHTVHACVIFHKMVKQKHISTSNKKIKTLWVSSIPVMGTNTFNHFIVTIVDPDPDWIWIQWLCGSGFWIRGPDPDPWAWKWKKKYTVVFIKFCFNFVAKRSVVGPDSMTLWIRMRIELKCWIQIEINRDAGPVSCYKRPLSVIWL
jgi:hypothetical protein